LPKSRMLGWLESWEQTLLSIKWSVACNAPSLEIEIPLPFPSHERCVIRASSETKWSVACQAPTLKIDIPLPFPSHERCVIRASSDTKWSALVIIATLVPLPLPLRADSIFNRLNIDVNHPFNLRLNNSLFARVVWQRLRFAGSKRGSLHTIMNWQSHFAGCKFHGSPSDRLDKNYPPSYPVA
jgi:hypothetical protein